MISDDWEDESVLTLGGVSYRFILTTRSLVFYPLEEEWVLKADLVITHGKHGKLSRENLKEPELTKASNLKYKI